jgi:single-stranded-DNA-specific exonuclease
VGREGLRLSIALPTGAVDAIAWGPIGDGTRLDVAQPVDLAFRLERDDYRGASRLQLRVHDVRRAQASALGTP